MKTIKTLVLIVALGLAGYAYAAGNTDDETRDCKMSAAAANCCVTDAKCCKSDVNSKSCADHSKSGAGCCGAESKCCKADADCSKVDKKSGAGCCGAESKCCKAKNT